MKLYLTCSVAIYLVISFGCSNKPDIFKNSNDDFKPVWGDTSEAADNDKGNDFNVPDDDDLSDEALAESDDDSVFYEEPDIEEQYFEDDVEIYDDFEVKDDFEIDDPFNMPDDDENDDDFSGTLCPPGQGGKDCKLCARYVVPTIKGDGSSLSWEHATASIQNAINSAQDQISKHGGRCSVFIKEGVYNITETVFMMDKIDIIGGFSGEHADPEFADPEIHPVILDGSGTSRVIAGASAAKLKNVTIQNGNAMNSSIKNGGGMIVFFAYDLKIENSKFIDNKAENGGAIFVGDYSDIKITDTFFENNQAQKEGGAVKIAEESRANFDRTHYLNNSAEKGGAISIESCGEERVYLFNSLFDKNSAHLKGGAIFNSGSSPFIGFNTFVNNSSYSGSVIHSSIGNEPYLAGNIFSQNSLSAPATGNYLAFYNNFHSEHPFPEGTGNINLDPLFVDIKNRNYRLESHSPSVDSVPLDLDFINYDLDGIPRPQNGILDMGCYER